MTAEQRKDPRMSAILALLSNQEATSAPRALHRQARPIRDELLYRRSYLSEGRNWLLVIPRHLRSTICDYFHADAQCTHAGVLNTYYHLRLRYYWRGMYTFIRKFVRSFADCQRRKLRPDPQAGSLQPLRFPDRPFDRVGIDLYGPLPLTASGNRWIIVAVDHLTRYAETPRYQPALRSKWLRSFYIVSCSVMARLVYCSVTGAEF